MRINIVDTPGHSDFGGEVERTLSMVDGILLLVDACEGPLPQTRFVLQKALEAGLLDDALHQQDRSRRRARGRSARRGLRSVHRSRRERGSARFPGALHQRARRHRAYPSSTVRARILRRCSTRSSAICRGPKSIPTRTLQFQVNNIDYDEYVGRLAIGRIIAGSITAGRDVLAVPGRRLARVVQSRASLRMAGAQAGRADRGATRATS